MSNTISLEVVDSEKFIFSGLVEFFIVPGSEGELGVYPHHISMIVKLKPGVLRYKVPNNDSQCIMAISGGFLEIHNNKATILADVIERTDALDEAMLIELKNQSLSKINNKTIDSENAYISLEIAIAQLKALEYIRSHSK